MKGLTLAYEESTHPRMVRALVPSPSLLHVLLPRKCTAYYNTGAWIGDRTRQHTSSVLEASEIRLGF